MVVYRDINDEFESYYCRIERCLNWYLRKRRNVRLNRTIIGMKGSRCTWRQLTSKGGETTGN
jgi:hypothetical protein